MNALQYINISLEILSCLVCLILLLCVITAEDRTEKLSRIFLSIVCCHIPLLLVDTAIFILEGRNGPYSNLIFKTAYFLSFMLGAVLLILFTRYLLTLIGIKTIVLRKTIYISRAAVAACGINMILIVFTQFYDLYYFISEGNIFYYGDWYYLSQILAFFCILINTGIMIAYRKSFEIRELVFLLSYAVLPMTALVVQNIVKGVVASIDVATTLIVLIFYAGIQSEQAKRLKERDLELSQSRVSVMLSQIQPHFLYNSLTGIQELCSLNPHMARQAVGEFSKYLRSNLDFLMLDHLIPFDKELDHVENYLRLEKMRFGSKLNVTYDTPVRNFYLPALTLQIVVENAVRHGITKREEGGMVTVSTVEEEGSYTITVTDNGVGFDASVPKKDGRSHIGMENVRSRLAAMCGGKLFVQSKPGIGTTAVITIPKGKCEEKF